MPAEPRTGYRIVAGLAIFLLVCCVPLVSAEESNGMVALDNATGK